MENFGDFRTYTLLNGKILEVNGFDSFRDEFVVYWDMFSQSLDKFGLEIRNLKSNDLEEQIGFIRNKLRLIKRSLGITLSECHSVNVINCATNIPFRARQIKDDNVAWFDFFVKMVFEKRFSYEVIEASKNLYSLLDEIAWRMSEFSKRCKIKKK